MKNGPLIIQVFWKIFYLLDMVQLRRMPLATMSPASTPSLLKRCRLGLRIKEFIHSPVAASTDLLFGNRIFFFFFFRFRNSCVFSLKHFRNNFPCHQVRQKSFDVRAVIIREIINIPPWEFRLLALFISSFFPGTRV